MQRSRSAPSKILLVALSFAASAGFLAHRVHAIDGFEISLESVISDQWRANGITTRIGLQARSQALQVRIDELRLSAIDAPLRNVSIDCSELSLDGAVVRCEAAQIDAVIPGLGAQRFTAAFSYNRGNDAVSLQARGLRIGGGSMAAQLFMLDDAWQIKGEVDSASVASLNELIQQFDIAAPVQLASGDVSARIEAAGLSDQVNRIDVVATVKALSANNEEGSLASEALDLSLQARAQHRAQSWTYEIELTSAGGQAYAQPVFLDLSAHSLTLKSQGERAADGTIHIRHFDVVHDGVSAARGSAALDLSNEQPLRDLDLKLETLQFPAAYDTYLQPVLLDTSFKAVKSAGRIDGSVRIRSGEPQALDVRFHDVSMDVNSSAMAIEGLQGQWRWTAQAVDDEQIVETSRIGWSGGALFGLRLGASELTFSTEARNFRLLEPARIPFLEGAIQLESLRARNVGLPSIAFMIDAEIQPVSVQQVSKAFGWPEFGGSLAGKISKLRMREGVLTLGTTLEARVFDGQVRVSDLKLEQPFGKWPRFYSSIALDRLDLELVTGAFSFGRITGRLSGEITGLEMFAWSPVAFDAKLYTPPGDRSRKRISQRAVENIGSIGGGGAGVTAALSSGFLRFFDEFNYAQLGISCRLHNEVCEMNGAAPAPNGGYYLVQGRGLPRIDVIGNSRRVDWPRLVQQLIAATESSGPVVD